MEIEKLVLPDGKELINVPADYNTLTDIGLTHEQAEGELLKHAKGIALGNMRAFAKAARARVASYADEYQLSNWTAKSQRAEKILNDSASEQEIAIVQAESDIRGKGESPKDLAQKQLTRSQSLAHAIGVIDGLESKGRNAIKSKKSLHKLEELIKELQADASKELNKLIGE